MGRVREKRRIAERRVEERRAEERRSERRKSQKKEDAGAWKGREVAKHCVFPMIWGSGGSKSKLAKAAGAEPAGQMRDEEVHAVVARNTFRSQNAQNTSKHTILGPLLEVEMSKKCTPRSTFRSQNVQNTSKRTTFGPLLDVQSSFRVASARDCAPCQKVSKTWGCCSISKKDGRRGTFEEDLQGCISRGRRNIKDMFIRDVRRSGRWFPERACILEHQICRVAKMILRDRCSTSYDLASFFRGRCSTLDRWSGKIAKRIGTRPSALHSTFHFWRASRRIALFLMLYDVVKFKNKIEEVSQNCFVLDVVKFKNWGSLAEFLRFWRCSVQNLRKSRRIAQFSSLQIDR